MSNPFLVSDESGEETVASAIGGLARAIDRLGNANAATPMGGLEVLGLTIREGMDDIAASLRMIAEAISETVNKDG